MKDFGVWSDNDLIAGDAWASSINNKIREIAKKGFVILLLTKNSINSRCVDLEAKNALKIKLN